MTSNAKPVARPVNPKLRSVRIEVGDEARNYVTGQQRVTMVPLTIRRKQYRKVMIPPPSEEQSIASRRRCALDELYISARKAGALGADRLSDIAWKE